MTKDIRDNYIYAMYKRGMALREIEETLSSFNLTHEAIRNILTKKFKIKFNRKRNPNRLQSRGSPPKANKIKK